MDSKDDRQIARATVGAAATRASRAARHAGGFSPVRRARFADQAYTSLFHKIVTGEFHEGEALPSENELGTLFGISRPVVREVLQRLRSDGLIASRRGSGSFVQHRRSADALDLNTEGKLRELLDNLEFRTVIELTTVSLAAERRDRGDLDAMQAALDEFEEVAIVHGGIGHHLDFKFHLTVATAARNRCFADAIRMVEYDVDHAVNLARYLVRFDHLERARSVHAEHARILGAIERQDAEAARAAMREHLEKARLRMMNVQPEAAATPSPPGNAAPPGAAGREAGSGHGIRWRR